MSEDINQVLSKFSYGMYIIASNHEGKMSGCIANAVMQITNVNPMIALSINKNNYTYDIMKKSGYFSFSVLTEQFPPSNIGTFGFTSGRETQKFENIPYKMVHNVPIITEHCAAYGICEIVAMHLTNTHVVILAKVIDAFFGVQEEAPMSYQYYHEVIKGKASKNAPTFRKEESRKVAEQKRYVCTVCGYVYEGDITQESDDYVCPICGVGKDMFEEVEE